MRKTSVFFLWMLLGTLCLVTFAHGEEAGGQEKHTGLDVAAIAGGLCDGDLWVTLLTCVLFGAVGGVVYELIILQGNIEIPHKPEVDEVTGEMLFAIPKFMYDLGVVARIIIGGLAAIAGVWVLSPPTTFSLLATSVVAGSAGISIFRSVQDRLLSALAVKEAAETKAKARAQNRKLKGAKEALSDFKQKVIAASSSPAGSTILEIAADSEFEGKDLDRVEALLSEAIGAGETL